ncbi:hypothetical protein Pfo_001902 [Paulownia fortunei]|nr:hypothetical protein Pfo_001902 [Paulownia fortunei]
MHFKNESHDKLLSLVACNITWYFSLSNCHVLYYWKKILNHPNYHIFILHPLIFFCDTLSSKVHEIYTLPSKTSDWWNIMPRFRQVRDTCLKRKIVKLLEVTALCHPTLHDFLLCYLIDIYPSTLNRHKILESICHIRLTTVAVFHQCVNFNTRPPSVFGQQNFRSLSCQFLYKKISRLYESTCQAINKHEMVDILRIVLIGSKCSIHTGLTTDLSSKCSDRLCILRWLSGLCIVKDKSDAGNKVRELVNRTPMTCTVCTKLVNVNRQDCVDAGRLGITLSVVPYALAPRHRSMTIRRHVNGGFVSSAIGLKSIIELPRPIISRTDLFFKIYLSSLFEISTWPLVWGFLCDGERYQSFRRGVVCVSCIPTYCLVFLEGKEKSTSPLQVLPTKFVLLSVVERLANKGSLGGIDALLGCPFHLPSSKLFSELSWQSLTAKQKQIAILSLYYAANGIRELLNVFSTQVVKECDTISQATKEDIILKLLKRLRNLVFVECLLDNCLKKHPVLFPELYPHWELSPVIEFDYVGDSEKMSQPLKGRESISQNRKRNRGKSSSLLANSNVEEKLKQPTIVDIWRKAGSIPSQEALKEDVSVISSKTRQSESEGNQADNSNIPQNIEISAPVKGLEAQKYKFRPLSVDCFSILACLENNQGSCCADPSAELPLHLYLLRDLHKKLDHLSPTRKQILARCSNASAGYMGMKLNDFLSKIRPLFPYLRRNFDRAVRILREGAETCQEHWITQSSLAANPEIINTSTSASPALTSISVFKETFLCLGKMLNLPDLLKEKTILSDLLQAFQPMELSGCFFEGLQLIPSPGNMDYLYFGAYIFLGSVFDMAINFSFTLASEVLLTLEYMVTSIRMFLNRSLCENGKDTCTGFSKEIVPFLCDKLGSYAQKLLMHKCDKDDVDSSLKTKGEMVHKILRIYLGNCQSASDSLNELACSILPQVSSCGTLVEDDNQTFPTLCPATMIVWYRVMHEENISTLNNLVKEIALLEKSRGGAKVENLQRLLNKILQSVNVAVSLINMCRDNDKVSVHALAVKYGGKFIDSFLKVFDFLQAQFQMHKDLILHLIKELQKATRTIQTLCSEAKGSKQTSITGKIPATKRSMERFLFHVKALLYATPSGCSFWMGNLKHKDLMGQVVSSQAYLDDKNDGINNDPAEAIVEDQPMNVSSPE